MTAFYTSNVEQYLFQNDAWQRYYTNVSTLPIDNNSTFIRAYFNMGFRFPPGIITPDLHSVQLLDSDPLAARRIPRGRVPQLRRDRRPHEIYRPAINVSHLPAPPRCYGPAMPAPSGMGSCD